MSGTRKSRRNNRQGDPEEISAETELKLAMAEREIDSLRKELKKLHRNQKSNDKRQTEMDTSATGDETLGATAGVAVRPKHSDAGEIINEADGNEDPVEIDGGDRPMIQPGNARVPRNDVPLPRQVVYDGKQPWDSFMKPFKSMAQHCRWTEEETRFRLLNSLRDIAAEYAYSVLPTDTLTFAQLEKALEDRFGEKRSPNTYLVALEQRKFGPKESLAEYGCDIKRLVTRGYPTADAVTRETIALRHFIKGLGDQQMIIAVGMRNDRSGH